MASSSRSRTRIPATDDQVELLEILQESRVRRPSRPSTNSSTLPALPTPVILFCGADQEKTDVDWDQRRPWSVQMLPESLSKETEPAYKRQKRSNGCGARVHARATHDRRWRGLVDGASNDVVKLDSEYFSALNMKQELLLGKEHCGCSRSGVGCAICGNPLGALFKPCARHAPSASHYTFLPSQVSPPLPRLSNSDDLPSSRGEREREALQRRMRDREELTQLRARIRAAQQQNRPDPRDLPPREPPPLPTFTTAVWRTVPEDGTGPSTAAPPPFSDLMGQQAREARDARRLRQEEARLAALSMRAQESSSSQAPMPRPWFLPPLAAPPPDESTSNAVEEQRAFEMWADETLERATATVTATTAGSAPDLESTGAEREGLTVADLRAMFQRPRQRERVRTETASGFTTPPPANLTQSEDERQLARLQRVENLFARTAAARTGPTGTRTIERRTAIPDIPDDDEQEKEELPRPRPFFER